jgi:hypothetical protein
MNLLKPARCAAVAAFAALAMVNPACAGMDALVMLKNLSPYKVDVSFPDSFKDCWNDTGAESDGRIDEYASYYQRSATSDRSYLPYLDLYQTTYNLRYLSVVPSVTMANTTQSLPAARDGEPVQHIAFRGEASASLFGRCKWQTSSRGFVVTLTDAKGVVRSKRHYVIADPSTSEWTLKRMKPFDENKSGPPTIQNTETEQEIMLGGGGRSSATEIALTAGLAAVTVVSIGQAGYQTYLAYQAVAQFNFWAVAQGGVQLTRLQLGKFLFVGGTHGSTKAGYLILEYGAKHLATNGAPRAISSLVTQGLVLYFSGTLDQSIKNPASLKHGQPDFSDTVVDFASPELYVNAGLKQDRSICVYHGYTLGITECRVVGIDLSVLPDGSIAFAPMPSVGSGG